MYYWALDYNVLGHQQCGSGLCTIFYQTMDTFYLGMEHVLMGP